MKKRLFVLPSIFVIFSLTLWSGLSGQDKPKTEENQMLYEAKLLLIKAKNSKDPNIIKMNVLKAEAIINKDSRSLYGHKEEALKWIKKSLQFLEENNIDMARKYAEKAKKQVFLAIEKLKEEGKY